ncbi:ADP-ribosylation factor-like protein 2-binding protein [Dendroctonus ponderosae]|nr:ADP-ribosylation factor-like protein 2-binding protein [Dendroctonus ponderosae]XP_048518375.1 ADP-ribosylation factor-like protein 2-binding protein [Dendroctonus ponderosae]XP_048521405.1 ADP-ribosylation factor-like protein 2-binding protein [Dendroctonus ponderosae]KAH0998918.1 hypothetical protein HUJ05_009576 [Dendroctonus ponderosae]KAH0998919.1 hypothetical protein HUJ05_009577 [Dendroctonus ponderosae]
MTEVDCNCQLGNGIEQNELDISHYCLETAEKSFAEIIGCIESIIISETFAQLQSGFLEQHYREFSEVEENRLVYTEIFNSYQATVEKYIEEQLTCSIPGFDIRGFEMELEKHPEVLDGEIYEMLSTFWDFANFKRMFLDYKIVKEGKGVDFSKDILVTKYSLNQETAFIQ